ncbi:MAG: flagellar biosynthetic protein FliO [Candidatus Lernaella stagnicola]|nr:flagellar biosynthetic protein FliO [Candidatus Lernaella stagnicola]
MRHRTIIFLLLLVATLWIAAPAAAELSYLMKMNFVVGVAPSGDACSLKFDVKNRAGLDGASVITKGRELHITFPVSYTHPPVRQFNKLESKCFQQVAMAQINKKTVRAVARLRDQYKGTTDAHVIVQGDTVAVKMGLAPAVAAPPVVAKLSPPPKNDIPEEAKVDLAAIFGDVAPKDKPAVDSPKPAAKQTEPAAAEAEQEAGFGISEAVIKMIVALCVTLALLVGLAALARRFKLPARLQGGKHGKIRVVQTGMIDMKRRIVVVDVAGELIVVALTSSGVTMLTKIESEQARRRLLGEPEPETAECEHEGFMGPKPIEPASFGRETETAPDSLSDAAATFSAKLRAYSRHVPTESTAAGHDTLRSIAERVKGLKRL